MRNWTDQELYDRCRLYGARALEWRRKFTGLLPEVNRRRLFEKKGFGSIFEFAKKLAGLSDEQVRLALNLDKRFSKLPQLQAALVKGQVSVNKLARVVSIATPENESELVGHLQQLSNRATELFVRDFKIQNGLLKLKNEPKNLHVQTFQLSAEVTHKLERLHGKGLDVNELLLELLERREQEIEAKKTELGEACEETSSRYIPVAVRRVVHAEYGDRCSMPNCPRPSDDLHHTQRFALAQRHDPRYLAPLCKNHHQIAHAVDARVQVERYRAMRH